MKKLLSLLVGVLFGWAVSVQANITIAADGSGNYTTFAAAMAGHTMTAGERITIKSGTYDERWIWNGSGTNGNEIIVVVNYGDTVTLRGIDVNTRNYVKVYGAPSVWKSTGLIIAQPTSAYNYAAISFNGGDHNWFQDVYVHDTYRGVEATSTSGNDYNVFYHCAFTGVAKTGLGDGTNTTFDYRGSYWSVMFCEFREGLDQIRPANGTEGRVHHNYFGLRNATVYTATSPYINHSDTLQFFESYGAFTYLDFSYNFDVDNQAGSADAANNYANVHTFIMQNTTTSTNDGTVHHVRLAFNFIGRVAGVNYIWNAINNVYATNNGHAYVNYEDTRNVNASMTNQYAPGDTYLFMNSYWVLSDGRLAGAGNAVFQDFGTPPTNFTKDYNRAYNSTGSHPSLGSQTHNTNVNANPTFVNSAADNFRLQASSTYIATGGPATTTTSSGSSTTSVPVTDSSLFLDPSVVPGQVGELVKVGSVFARMVSKSGNTLTVTPAISYGSGDEVRLKGMEDIGPLPYAYATSFTVSVDNTYLNSGVNSLSATVDNTDAVLAVEWLVDGVSVGVVSTSPYTQSYTSDGGTHKVKARALRYWGDFADGATVTEDEDTLSPAASGTPAHGRRGGRTFSSGGL